jgi:predicted amidohydrolase
MHIATVQLEVGPEIEANRATAEARIREAAENGADLVVLPEIWNVGYFHFDAYAEKAEALDGPTMTNLRRLADERDIHLHTGSIVEEDGNDLYNTSALIAPDGELLDTYRKVHLFGYESQESRLLTPGDRIVAVETDVGTVGLTTCFDFRFPELYRALVDEGVELLLITSAWPDARVEHWQLFSRVRAIESQTFLAAANLTGTNDGVELAGQSVIVDPWGIPLANAGTGERTAYAEVDLSEVSTVREDFPILGDRRIEADYSL